MVGRQFGGTLRLLRALAGGWRAAEPQEVEGREVGPSAIFFRASQHTLPPLGKAPPPDARFANRHSSLSSEAIARAPRSNQHHAAGSRRHRVLSRPSPRGGAICDVPVTGTKPFVASMRCRRGLETALRAAPFFNSTVSLGHHRPGRLRVAPCRRKLRTPQCVGAAMPIGRPAPARPSTTCWGTRAAGPPLL